MFELIERPIVFYLIVTGWMRTAGAYLPGTQRWGSPFEKLTENKSGMSTSETVCYGSKERFDGDSDILSAETG